MNFPIDFIDSIKQNEGFSEVSFAAAHNEAQQLVSIRLNPAKCGSVDELDFAELVVGEVPWCKHAYYLKERPSFITDPILHAGAYYVQEASSMFLHHIILQLNLHKEKTVALDLSAAPGGKSTLLSSALNAESLLVCNEVIKPRANVLVENLTKWGNANVVVTNNDPADFARLGQTFDLVVVDAPCSGSGLFRKDPTAMSEWSLQNVQLCAERQKRILADVLPALKTNGHLVYSTCSYSKEENEDILDWLATFGHIETVDLQVEDSWGIVETKSASGYVGYRFYPDKAQGEGFFVSVLRKKKSNKSKTNNKRQALKFGEASKKETEILLPHIKANFAPIFLKMEKDFIVFPNEHLPLLQHLAQTLYIKKAGILLGMLKDANLIPAHDWAISNLKAGCVEKISIDKLTALEYLRCNNINLEAAKIGWAIVVYKNHSLGLVKNLGNRVNNYYPREWRIINK